MFGNMSPIRAIMFMNLCVSTVQTHSKTIGPELFCCDNISHNEVFVQLEQDWIFL